MKARPFTNRATAVVLEKSVETAYTLLAARRNE